jgi:hypothetical protein
MYIGIMLNLKVLFALSLPCPSHGLDDHTKIDQIIIGRENGFGSIFIALPDINSYT